MTLRVGSPTGVRRGRNVVRVGLHTSLTGQVSQLSLVHAGRIGLGRCASATGSRNDKIPDDGRIKPLRDRNQCNKRSCLEKLPIGF